MEKRKIARAASVVALMVGLACLLYPLVSDYMFQKAQEQISVDYHESVSESAKEDLSGEWEKARAYNEGLRNSKAVVTDPFDPALTMVSLDGYDGILAVPGSEPMCMILVPSVGIEVPVYHGVADSELVRGAGHLEGTSLPVGGESTHCVIAGHTGLPAARIFDSLDKVNEGDYVIVEVLDETHAYKINEIEVVLPDETDSLVIREGEDEITLVTCTPYGINSHRLLVHAQRCEVPAEWESEETTPSTTVQHFFEDRGVIAWSAAGIAVGAAICLIALAIGKRRSAAATSAE